MPGAREGSSRPGPSGQPRAAFDEQVRDALLHLHDLPHLQKHPLTRRLGTPSALAAPSGGKRLQRVLLDLIEETRPRKGVPATSHAWRTHTILRLRFVEALDVPDVMAQVAIGRAEYFRDQRRALEAIGAMLLEQRGPGEAAPASSGGGAPEPRPTESAESAVAARLSARRVPIQLSGLFGRAREIASVSKLLRRDDVRLVTLTGLGGIGKTSLAVAVATELGQDFESGVVFVPLDALTDHRLVASTIAQALAVPEMTGRSPWEAVLEHLRERRLLLVLDNFEQVLAAAADVARLLGSCPNAKLLVTSRSPLHLRGEHEFQVASLDVPEHHHGLGIEEVEPFAAVQLFVERARAVRADFALTTTNAAPVAAICQRLDGIPLAIELAAALVKALPVQTLAERLPDQPRLLTGRDPTARPRQQTLQATFDWSHDLLAGPERILFRRLAVFAGGFSLEAAEVVAAGDGIEGSDILPLLVQLVDKSLLVLQEQRGIARYRLLEPLRQYGWERLVEAGEAEVVGRRHAAYYGALAEEAEPSLEGPDQALWLDRLEREHNNVRAALRWSGDGGDVELGLRLGGALWLFWFARGHLSEGRDWLSRLLAGAGMSRTAARAKALKAAGMLAHYQGDDAAETRLLAESLAIRCELGDRLAPADMLVFQGDMAYRRGELARARSLFEEGLGLNRALGNEQGVAEVLAALSGLAWDEGDYALARSLREESVSVNRKLGDQAGIAWMLLELGRIVLQQDDLPSAHACFRESLLVARALEFPWGILHTLEGLAEVAVREGKVERAARLSGAAAAIRNGMHLWDVPGGRVRSGRQLGPGRHHVGADTATAAWAEGQAMTLEQAIAYALEEDGPSLRGERMG